MSIPELLGGNRLPSGDVVFVSHKETRFSQDSIRWYIFFPNNHLGGGATQLAEDAIEAARLVWGQVNPQRAAEPSRGYRSEQIAIFYLRHAVIFSTRTAATLNSGILARGSKASALVSTFVGFSPK